MERRNHPRRQVIRNALLYHPQGFLCPCWVDNISLGGLFIKMSNSQIHKGSSVDLVIDVSPLKDRPVTAKALVVHKKDHGIGLLCENDVPLHELFETLQ